MPLLRVISMDEVYMTSIAMLCFPGNALFIAFVAAAAPAKDSMKW